MKKTYNMETTKPVYLEQLAAERGRTRVADDMGIGKSTLSEMLSRGEVRVVYERLAKEIIERRNRSANNAKATIAVIRVTRPDDLPYLRRMLDGLGIKMIEFREDE